VKCVRFDNGQIRRVTNHAAAKFVKNHQACYVPKQEWKDEVRDKDLK